MITQEFDLNLIPEQEPVIVHVDQYDHGTGRLVINLYDGDTAYPVDGTAIIQGIKPDGHGFTYSVTVDGSQVTADLTEQMSAVAGDTRAQIVVTESDGRTGTFVFILRVQKSALPDDTDLSDSDYQLIEDAIEAAETLTFPLATNLGGTGNRSGYIRTGKLTGSTEGNRSTIEGYWNTASGYYSHAEGRDNVSSGPESHTEGRSSTASGEGSHAQGYNCLAAGDYSTAVGWQNRANYDYQSVCGQLNDNKSTTLFEVGNGAGQNRSNAFEVYANGDINVGGEIKVQGQAFSLGKWTTPVSCLTGDTTVTITDANLTTNSTILATSCQTASGEPAGWSKIEVTNGQAVMTFLNPLTENTEIKIWFI